MGIAHVSDFAELHVAGREGVHELLHGLVGRCVVSATAAAAAG